MATALGRMAFSESSKRVCRERSSASEMLTTYTWKIKTLLGDVITIQGIKEIVWMQSETELFSVNISFLYQLNKFCSLPIVRACDSKWCGVSDCARENVFLSRCIHDSRSITIIHGHSRLSLFETYHMIKSKTKLHIRDVQWLLEFWTFHCSVAV